MKTELLLSIIFALTPRVNGFVHMSRPIHAATRLNQIGTLRVSNSDDSSAAASTTTKILDDGSKVCLVTGASRGIGKCIALELFKAGNVKVVINDIEPMREEAEQVCVLM